MYGKQIKMFVRMFVVLIGLIGNLVLIIFFSRKRNKLSFYGLMIMLSAYNVLMITMDFLIFSVPLLSTHFEESIFYNHHVIKVGYTLLEVGVTGSIYSTIAVSVERYLVVCHPFYAESHKFSTKTQIVLVSVLTVIYNIPTIFELETYTCKNENVSVPSQCQKLASIRSGFIPGAHNCSSGKVFLVPSELRCNKKYFLIYHIGLDLLFKCVIPFVTLAILNGLIIRALAKYHAYHQRNTDTKRRSTIISIQNKVYCIENETNKSKFTSPIHRMESQEFRLALTNLLIVLVFIICHSVIWIPKIYEALMGSLSDIKRVFDGFKLGYFFTALNSSINCYVYFFTHCDPILSMKSLFRTCIERRLWRYE